MRLIDADKLPEHKFTRESAKGSDYMRGWNDAIDAIGDNEPTVERPQGEWEALNYHTCYCTNCRFDFDIMKCDFMTKMNFCPNCGADMRGEEE